MAECFFCFENRKLTKAHLFQRQIRNALQVGGQTTYLSASSAAHRGTNRATSFPGDMRNMNVASLCAECNGVWMQRIEVGAASAFAALVEGETVPPPLQMFELAHWSVVFAALSSELFPATNIPREQRRVIRQSGGHPDLYSTYAVWTGDYMRSVQTDLYRAVSRNGEVEWASLLHAGAVVIISVTPGLLGRVPRVLEDADVASTLGFVGTSGVFVPEGFHASMNRVDRPTHAAMHELGPRLAGGGGAFVRTSTGGEVLDLSRGLELTDVEMSYDFRGRLIHPHQLRGSSVVDVSDDKDGRDTDRKRPS